MILKILKLDEILEHSIKIESNNNFNTAAGLASSSSGLSCLGVALANLYGCRQTDDFDFSVLARLGSGSAVRSVYGYFVKWEKGWMPEMKDSIISQDSEALEVASRHSIAKQVTLND
jgi:diphosphomevalonate decarboxylase